MTYNDKRRNNDMKNESRTILIGKKPSMSYVMAAMTQFGRGENEVVLKARGKAINSAVDVTEILKNRFLKDMHVAITTGTERLVATRNTAMKNKEMNVSTIEITLRK